MSMTLLIFFPVPTGNDRKTLFSEAPDSSTIAPVEYRTTYKFPLASTDGQLPVKSKVEVV